MAETVRVDGRTRDTRVRIRAAATELFYTQGFPSTSVREITAACSVTPGALYNHYGSKEAILADIFHETRTRVDALIERSLRDGEPSPARSLGLVAAALTWFHAAHRRQGMVVLTQEAWMPASEEQDLRAWRRDIRRLVERLLREGIQAGEVSVPLFAELDDAVAVTAKGLLDLWTNVGAWFREEGSTSSTEVAGVYARLTLQSIDATSEDEAIDRMLAALSDTGSERA